MPGDVRDLTFRFLGVDAGAGRQFDRMASKAGITGGALEKVALGATAAAGAVAVAAVKMAGNFQNAVVHLQTDAGESAKNLKMVGDGILKLTGQVGVSAGELAKGMYYVESAGYHGAQALTVLKAAAEGAKVGNADLITMSDALTSALKAYHLTGKDAVSVTNQMIGAVSHGKMKMEDLAGALGSVLPAAASAHIGLNEVLGAIATMTAQGTSADKAATYLRQTILKLENPTGKAVTEMQSLGLSAIDVSKNLGARGLTGTLQLLTDAIAKKMGPAGTVLIDKLQKAAGQTKDYNKTTQALRQTTDGYVKTVTNAVKTGDTVTKTITTLTDKHGVLTKHVATSTSVQQNFNQILADLPPAQQTYVAALANMVGGTKSMQAALELTGGNAKDFIANTKLIGEEAKHAGKDVKDWAAIQATFNQKADEARYSLGALEIKLGTALLPTATHVMDYLDRHAIPSLEKFGQWFARNKQPIKDVAEILLPLAAAMKAFSIGSSVLGKVGVVGKGAGLLGGSMKAPVPVFVTNWGPGKGVPGVPPVGGPNGRTPTPTPTRSRRFAEGTLRIGASLVQGASLAHMLEHAGPRPIDKAAAVAAGGFAFGATGGEISGNKRVVPFDAGAIPLSPANRNAKVTGSSNTIEFTGTQPTLEALLRDLKSAPLSDAQKKMIVTNYTLNIGKVEAANLSDLLDQARQRARISALGGSSVQGGHLMGG